MSDLDGALGLVETAIQLDPISPRGHGVHAELLFAKGRLDEARAAIERALTVRPEHERWPELLALHGVIEQAWLKALMSKSGAPPPARLP